MKVSFQALEYGEDQGFHPVEMRYCGSTEEGWEIHRNGQPHLHLGPGYVLLQSSACGVCSTDLARHHLPFPLPQITGHEVLALDEEGRRYVVEINASHLARGVDSDCELCNEGMDTHCPDRLVLGIHDLPGGFGPWILVPKEAILPVPDSIPDETALLLEPFAAALHIEDLCPSDDYPRIAVLGPRRLGQLAIAAYSILRRQLGLEYHLTALTRHQDLADLATRLGADETVTFTGSGEELPSGAWDLVIDTTGSPSGLDLALRLASKEVHVKSTHGQPAGGLERLTEMVVDELSIEAMPNSPAAWNSHLQGEMFGRKPHLLWATEEALPKGLANRARITRSRPQECPREILGSFDFAVADDLACVDRLIRPLPQEQISCLRPQGLIFLDAAEKESGPLAKTIRGAGLRLSTSRCGDMEKALHLLEPDPLGPILGKLLITHHLASSDLAKAVALAARPESVKIAIHHTIG